MAMPTAYIDLEDEYPSCGTLSIVSLVDLASASGTVDVVSLSIYAHMESPMLSLPVSNVTPRTYLPQMGKKKGNTGKASAEVKEASTQGYVSGPLSIASRWAGYLTHIPVIGPYATAASTFSSQAADFAKFFGYSRPRDLAAPDRVIRCIAGNFANTDSVDTSQSLAVRETQGLSIDPRIYGTTNGEDELALSQVYGKWGLVKKVDWTVGSSVGTKLLGGDVKPNMFVDVPLPDAQMAVCPPVYFAAIPFSMWSGTMEIKVQVICSKYHRGRLLIQWHPSSTTADPGAMNSCFSHVLEISDQIDHTFQVPWAQPFGYGQVDKPAGPANGSINGTFSVSVQNELVSPEALNDAHILIWTRGGSDFKLAVPRNDGHTLTTNFIPQMGDKGIEDAEVSEQVHSFFDSKTFPEFHDVFVADPVLSFRPLLKRYTHSVTLQPPVDNNLNGNATLACRFALPIYPVQPGTGRYVEQWASVATGDLNVNSTHLMNYLQNPFLGRRGSFRWKVQVTVPSGLVAKVQVCRHNVSNIGYEQEYLPANAFNQTSHDAGLYGHPSSRGLNAAGGMQVYDGTNETSRLVEFEVPYYEPYRFTTANVVASSNDGKPTTSGTVISVYLYNPTSGNLSIGELALTCWAAAGEDFSMGIWRGIDPPFARVYGTTAPPQISGYEFGID